MRPGRLALSSKGSMPISSRIWVSQRMPMRDLTWTAQSTHATHQSTHAARRQHLEATDASSWFSGHERVFVAANIWCNCGADAFRPETKQPCTKGASVPEMPESANGFHVTQHLVFVNANFTKCGVARASRDLKIRGSNGLEPSNFFQGAPEAFQTDQVIHPRLSRPVEKCRRGARCAGNSNVIIAIRRAHEMRWHFGFATHRTWTYLSDLPPRRCATPSAKEFR